MRAVLMRFVMEPFWSAKVVDGTPILGFGFALIPWFLIGSISLWYGWKNRESEDDSSPTDLLMSLGTFIGVPLAAYFFLPAGLRKEGIPIFGYGLMMFCGIAAGTGAAVWNSKKLGLKSDVIMDMSMWLIVPGIIGGRMFYVIQKGLLKGKGLADGFAAIINLPDGGLVFYGAVIGGMFGFFLYCYRKNLNVMMMGDIILPSLFLGLGFGRIGCFLYGCCYGGMCKLPWAVRFPKASVPFDAQVQTGFLSPDATQSLPLHPTQIYSSINAFLLATVLILYFRRHRPYNGAVLAIGWLVYPIARFTIEEIRNDELGVFGTPFTISQWISIILFVTGIIFTSVLVATGGKLSKPKELIA